MKDGRCSKGFPKPLVEVTRANVNGYAEYRRRRRPAGVLKFRNREYDNATVNQWVVPYNPYLSQKYNCHINVEVCTGITAVKYLYKYVYKGSDKAVFTIEVVRNGCVRGSNPNPREEPNEVIRYLNGRYISPVEACMRLLNMVIQGKSHSVEQLTVHLEGKQVVVFRSDENPRNVIRRGEDTMLTRFFELCASDAPENQIAKTMLYQDIPRKFSWKNKRWVRRTKYQAALGRMIHVSPRDIERFHLRIMLSHRRGPTSYDDLKTVHGELCSTFQEAADRAGYLENDVEWAACMTEAASFKKPIQLRQLFATLLVYSMPSDVRALWDQFYGDLSYDFAYTYRDVLEPIRTHVVMFETLKNLQELLMVNGYSVSDFKLPQLHNFKKLVLQSLLENSLIRRELTSYNQSALEDIVSMEDQLNPGQKDIYDQVIGAVNQPEVGKKMFFIDGPGGTGKSTLLRNIQWYSVSSSYGGTDGALKNRNCGRVQWYSVSSSYGGTDGALNIQDPVEIKRSFNMLYLQTVALEEIP
ncbi:hypothetical protein PR001_g21539 [Phytophthora rubi]|uniref:ATP-dependent DNA helicase n=1 Tax=Phytophthora rubi TaxID=129364 RepID=A0A6A3J4U9_9STRA|nr:hypothetical protein PR001_g21539 [Phytophthora rubi]